MISSASVAKRTSSPALQAERFHVYLSQASNPVTNDVIYIYIGLNGSKYRGKLKYSGGTGGIIYDVLAGAGTGSPCS